MLLSSRTAVIVFGVAGATISVTAAAQTPPGTSPPGATAPGTAPAAADKGLNDPAYVGARNNAIPLTPAMILDLKQRFDAAQRARTGDDGTSFPASPLTRSVNVSLGPGGVTTIVETVPGYPTAVVFLDSTGQPWPIAWDTNGLPVSGGGAATVTLVLVRARKRLQAENR